MIRTTGYSLERVVEPVDKRKIDEHFIALARQFAKWKKVDLPQVGDRVSVSIMFRHEDSPPESYKDKFIIGGGRADKAIEDMILEMYKDLTLERVITTVENPRTLWVLVTLEDVERMIPAVINNKLIHRTTKFKSLSAYTQHMKKRLKEEEERKADDRVQQQLFTQLANAYPETDIDQSVVDKLLAESTARTAEQKLREEYHAQQHVKALKILSQVAEQEGLQATDWQFRQYAISVSKARNRSLTYVLKQLDRAQVMMYLSQKNAISFLVKQNLGK